MGASAHWWSFWLCAGLLPAQAEAALFDRVVAVLGDRFVDADCRRTALAGLAECHRPPAVAAADPTAAAAAVDALLAAVGTSHLALLSAAAHRRFEAELRGERLPTSGCVLVEHQGRFYIDAVLDGGPAARAGLRRGDEVLQLDGAEPAGSPLLDRRSDDARAFDLPVRELLVQGGQRVALTVRGDGAPPRTAVVVAGPWSTLAASAASARSRRLGGHPVLQLHLWSLPHGHAAALLAAALAVKPAPAGLLLDLRGRGGSALEALLVADVVHRAHRDGIRTVALVDASTRSAKEILAHELQARGLAVLVGERTAGAVLAADFAPVGDGLVLMLPTARLPRYSRLLEGTGVTPDYHVHDPPPHLPGLDPVLATGRLLLEGILDRSPPPGDRR